MADHRQQNTAPAAPRRPRAARRTALRAAADGHDRARGPAGRDRAPGTRAGPATARAGPGA
ncbi:hypothetical protein ACFF45_35465, partial [Streptomyces cinereospinus]